MDLTKDLQPQERDFVLQKIRTSHIQDIAFDKIERSLPSSSAPLPAYSLGEPPPYPAGEPPAYFQKKLNTNDLEKMGENLIDKLKQQGKEKKFESIQDIFKIVEETTKELHPSDKKIIEGKVNNMLFLNDIYKKK